MSVYIDAQTCVSVDDGRRYSSNDDRTGIIITITRHVVYSSTFSIWNSGFRSLDCSGGAM